MKLQVLLEESFLLSIQSSNRHLVNLVMYLYSFSLKQNEFCSNICWQTSAGLRVLFFTFIAGGSEMLKHLTTREEHCTATPVWAQRGRRDVARKPGSGGQLSRPGEPQTTQMLGGEGTWEPWRRPGWETLCPACVRFVHKDGGNGPAPYCHPKKSWTFPSTIPAARPKPTASCEHGVL